MPSPTPSAPRPTTCPMDCPDTCALEARVDGGDVLALGGAAAHPVTAGFICSKVARFHRRLDHAERLLHPLRRSGAKGDGRFERISWDGAIAEITERFREIRDRAGGEAILPFHYGGSNGLLSDGLVDRLYFARLGASRLAKTICAAPTGAAAAGLYGKMPGVAMEDYVHARCIVLWGANPKASQIHLVPFLRRAKENGAFLAVVDPRRNFSAAEIDLHLAVRPGADLPLALGLVHHWQRDGRLDREFLTEHAMGLEPLLEAAAAWPPERAADVAGVAADDLLRLADVWAETSPAVVRCGWGLERNRSGARAAAAVMALPALTGKFGVRGGGYTMSNSAVKEHDAAAVLGGLEWTTRVVNMNELGRWIVPRGEGPRSRADRARRDGRAAASSGLRGGAGGPPVEALFVYNANPAVTVPDQRAVLAGLEREDLFTVVFDQVMTDTARLADLVLPATTFLEHWDLRVGYGNYGAGAVRPVVPRRGEARPNVEVFAALGRAMGFDDEPFGWDEEAALRRVVESLTLNGRPVDAERLAAGLWHRPHFSDAGPPAGREAPVQFRDVVPRTADGKVHLTPASFGVDPWAWEEVADPRFPLALITPASHHTVTSSMGEYDPTPLAVTLHPDDAAARGLVSGDAALVFNHLGEVECAVKVSDAVRPGVASMPKGAWRRASRNGATSTALTPATLEPVSGGACFNDARVEVARTR